MGPIKSGKYEHSDSLQRASPLEIESALRAVAKAWEAWHKNGGCQCVSKFCQRLNEELDAACAAAAEVSKGDRDGE